MRHGAQRGIGCALALIYFVVLASPSLGQVLESLGAKITTLAPLVREITPSVVNISVHGRVKEDNPFYRDPSFREFFDAPHGLERGVQAVGSGVIVDAQKG
jgi:serine protease Do